MRVAVIGGGAAGFFFAINCAELHPDWEIHIFEQGKQVLAKVKVSGGGRCNVTHACFHASTLSKFYPRGEKFLKSLFGKFQPQNTVDWFKARGIELKTEADNRMFPTTDRSQTIIDCFLQATNKAKVAVHTSLGVRDIAPQERRWDLKLTDGTSQTFDRVMIATGGKKAIWEMLAAKGHTIVSPLPSLFTFNCKDQRLEGIPGLSVPKVTAKVAGTKLEAEGPWLVTHWGMSGPAILKLSSFGARVLAEKNYQFDLLVNFVPDVNQEGIRAYLHQCKADKSRAKIQSNPEFSLPKRLWYKMLAQCEITDDLRWMDASKKHLNRLVEELTNARFEVNGKSTFKEEFVTAGGISLAEVDKTSMESRLLPGIFFAGEVLDIDAVTGGFNFQAAWTTAWVASRA